PLELFFDLVFVLAITQCSALMVEEASWAGLGKGLVVLGVIWWGWVGYSWLTSVIDPEEGAVRIAMFAAMAGFLVVALCVPDAFGDLGLTFALAYGAVRAAHIVLFVLASRQDGGLRHSVLGLAISTAVGVTLLAAASQVDGTAQGVLWVVALALDMGGPLVIDPSGWRLEPAHFAERHGLIIIIALGESIIALGASAGHEVDGTVLVAAVAGLALSAGLWWLYFDVISYVAGKVLVETADPRQRNPLARDSYSYLHFVLVAGIVLTAVGLHDVLVHPDEPLGTVASVALFGGAAVYLLGHAAFYLRCTGNVKPHRVAAGIVFAALVPLGTEIDALPSLVLAAAVVAVLLVYEN
ncbi:MAG TPA: low temperature requirement protein A, partial [Acidimicrobiales bacterium]|nr:low temperature requirement protein A [Acidimicrobiales bacterium]